MTEPARTWSLAAIGSRDTSGQGPDAYVVALVRAGATFVNGKLIEQPEDQLPEASDTSPAAAEVEVAEAA